MKNSILVLLLINYTALLAQSVGIGTTNPNNSSILDVQSTNKGVLLPRMTTAQRKAIVTPEVGLMIYDLDKKTIMIYDGAKWGHLVFKNTEITEPTSKLIADGEMTDYFGNAVSLSGDYAVAGAYGDDVNGKHDQGSAYVFHRINSSWVQEAQLFATDGASNDLFGSSVSISGNYIVVGSPRDQVGANGEQGSVYVFVRNGTNWTQQHKFVAPDGAAGDHFGYCVSMSGPQFLVGTPRDDVGANSNQGSATLFLLTGSTWAQEVKLTANDGTSMDEFGTSVAVSGIYAIVGAPGYEISQANSGTAYLYSKIVAWSFNHRVIASGSGGILFGETVAIDASTAVVRQTITVPYATFGTSSGEIFIYTRNAFGIWSEQAILLDPHPPVSNIFGFSASLSGDYLAVGTIYIPFATVPGTDSAYVSLYKRTGTTWEEETILYGEHPTTNGKFGYAVFINGFNLIIGAPHKKNKKGEINFLNIE